MFLRQKEELDAIRDHLTEKFHFPHYPMHPDPDAREMYNYLTSMLGILNRAEACGIAEEASSAKLFLRCRSDVAPYYGS